MIPAEPKRKRGKKCEVDMREVVNALFYILRAGCSWRMMPCAFYLLGKRYIHICDAGNLKEYGKKFMLCCDSPKGDVLRIANKRNLVGCSVEPSAGIIDSQIVKITEKG